jgi:O-methyltransferase involved in polyketide biosynthesis
VPVSSGGSAGAATGDDDWSSRFDTSTAHPARTWDYWLGGKDNFAADREAADLADRALPSMRRIARADRAFLGNVVRYLAGEAGIRQFLDIGTGLPTTDNTHEVAQRTAPESRIVYADNDPIVLSHARALLTSSPQGKCDYIDSDLRDLGRILDRAAATLDLSQPVAIMLLGILLYLPDADDPHGIVARLLAAVPPGSYLAVSHGASDIDPERSADFTRIYNERSAVPFTLRTRAEVTRFFDGTDLIDPGVVQVHRWRISPQTPGYDDDLITYCGLGRKP